MKLALPRRGTQKKRADGTISIDQWLSAFQFNGATFPILNQSLPGVGQTEIQPTMMGVTDGALKANGIVFGVTAAHMRLFSEARLQYQPLGSFANGDLYGKPSLGILENPWPGGTQRDLLALMSLYKGIAGNAYVCREDARTLRVARPDYMTIVLGTRREGGQVGDLDTEIIGYAYKPPTGRVQALLPENVAHWRGMPDPSCRWRGISWLHPVIAEIQGDIAATAHKNAFFANGATANLVVTLDPNLSAEEFEEWTELFDEGHKGALEAYKTIYLAGGADVKVVGTDMKQMDFVNTQGHGEARICVAAGMPPILANVVKGLDSATYSNYGQAKRVWADGTMRPDWGGACEALQKLVDVPSDSRLWYDDRHIMYLQEDRKDLAATQEAQARTLRQLTDAGFEPESAVAFVESGDLGKLRHSGLYSVQLQPPGTEFKPTGTPAQDGKQAVRYGLALECSHCHEQAAENVTCKRCVTLATALDGDRDATLVALAIQTGAEPDALIAHPPADPAYPLAQAGPDDPTMYGLKPAARYELAVRLVQMMPPD